MSNGDAERGATNVMESECAEFARRLEAMLVDARLRVRPFGWHEQDTIKCAAKLLRSAENHIANAGNMVAPTALPSETAAPSDIMEQVKEWERSMGIMVRRGPPLPDPGFMAIYQDMQRALAGRPVFRTETAPRIHEDPDAASEYWRKP